MLVSSGLDRNGKLRFSDLRTENMVGVTETQCHAKKCSLHHLLDHPGSNQQFFRQKSHAENHPGTNAKQSTSWSGEKLQAHRASSLREGVPTDRIVLRVFLSGLALVVMSRELEWSTSTVTFVPQGVSLLDPQEGGGGEGTVGEALRSGEGQ